MYIRTFRVLPFCSASAKSKFSIVVVNDDILNSYFHPPGLCRSTDNASCLRKSSAANFSSDSRERSFLRRGFWFHDATGCLGTRTSWVRSSAAVCATVHAHELAQLQRFKESRSTLQYFEFADEANSDVPQCPCVDTTLAALALPIVNIPVNVLVWCCADSMFCVVIMWTPQPAPTVRVSRYSTLKNTNPITVWQRLAV